jgi:hypothetical protein
MLSQAMQTQHMMTHGQLLRKKPYRDMLQHFVWRATLQF